MDTKKLLLGVAMASLLGGAIAPVAVADDAKTFECAGGNGCKGKSECKTANNACAGQNGCGGKGMIKTKDEAECKKAKDEVAKHEHKDDHKKGDKKGAKKKG